MRNVIAIASCLLTVTSCVKDIDLTTGDRLVAVECILADVAPQTLRLGLTTGPDLFRLDVGYRFGFRTGRLQHEVNLGVCNATNHFNPFMLYYDAETKGWKEMALLPVLPNFSWRVTF